VPIGSVSGCTAWRHTPVLRRPGTRPPNRWLVKRRNRKDSMKKLTLAILFVGFFVTPLVGQSPQKIARINKKVVGKWWSADRKNYIEFFANGVCLEGALSPQGKWNTQEGKLGAWQVGESFYCLGGALTLIGPNTLTRDYGMGGEPERYYRGLQNIPQTPTNLSLTAAQRILNQQINMPTVNNTLFTCHACYDPSDKQDNDKAPLVSTYSTPFIQFMIAHGYVRTGADQQYFTAKAKRSKYYGGDGPLFGFRFANFGNPRILTDKIVDLNHVPIVYDFVPTELTKGFFGKVQKVRSVASFSYENEAWRLSAIHK